MSERVDAFVVAAPGLEPLLLDEVVRLGIRPARVVRGGVECTVTWRQVWSMNLRLRIATRVLVRVASFRADGPGTLTAGLRRVDWGRWLPCGPVEVHATSDARSGLFHSGAVRRLVEESIAAAPPRGDDGSDNETGQPQTLMARVVADTVTVSLDASGSPLHHRGWRGASGRAPMRETLAAALLASSGWKPGEPLVDPFCGSGTVLVEAALIARRMAPGRHRGFACQQWPSFDHAAWSRIVAGLDADVVERCPPILGSDRDEGVVGAARENADRAGVGECVEVRHASVSDSVPPAGNRRGWVVSNPPYGERVSPGRSLVPLYDAFGRVLRERFGGWRVALLAADAVPLQATGLEWSEPLRTANGGIPVRVAVSSPVP